MRRDMALEERSIRDLVASITGEAAEAAAQFAATTGLDGIENVFNALTAANQRAEGANAPPNGMRCAPWPRPSAQPPHS